MTLPSNRNHYGCWICGGFNISSNYDLMTKWCCLGCCYYSESGTRSKMSPCICSSSPDSNKTCCCIFGNYTWGGSNSPSLCCAFPFGMYNYAYNKEQLNLCWIFGQYERYKSNTHISDDLTTLHPCGFYSCTDNCSTQTCCYTWGLGCICNQINNRKDTNATCWICSIPPFVVRQGRCCQQTKGCCQHYGCCCPDYENCGIVDTNTPKTTVVTILPVGEIEWYPIPSRSTRPSSPVLTNAPSMSHIPSSPEMTGSPPVTYGVAINTICCNYDIGGDS